MKKKILFIMESLGIGGAEKSLITILNEIDYSMYDVDLLLFSHKGEFFEFIPKNVNVLPEDKTYKIFNTNRKVSFVKYLLKFKLKEALYSFLWNVGALVAKVKKQKLYIGWKYVSKLVENVENEYDTSIAFLERKSIYFNVDKVKSKNKIGFIHNDYSKYPYDDKLDRHYFKYYNKIPTVSVHCKEVLVSIFPEYTDKFVVIKNMVSKKLIVKMTDEPINDYGIDKNYLNIVSVGRLNYQKGFDDAVKICHLLIEKGMKVHWYVVGEGEERKKIEKMIKNDSLENVFFLVGADKNPYKWMNIADVYVQPSRFEGFGITVAEAIALNKKIVARAIPEFKELLDSDCLAEDIEEFATKIAISVENKKSGSNVDTTGIEELNKLYEII